MITKQTGSTGSISSANRILLNQDGTVKQVITPKPFTRTYCSGDILEVSEEIIPKETAKEAVHDILKGMVFADQLDEKEMLGILCLYKKWDDIKIGDTIESGTLLVKDDKLYKVNQAHDKQAGWTSGKGTKSLYTSVMPADVIGE